AGARHRFGGFHDLLFAFHRAGTGHDHELIAADLDAIDNNLSAMRAKLAAHEFVRGRDADRLLHLRHRFHGLETGGYVADADDADHHALLTLDGMNLVAKVLDALKNLLDFLSRRARLHRNNHAASINEKGSLRRVSLFETAEFRLRAGHSLVRRRTGARIETSRETQTS